MLVLLAGCATDAGRVTDIMLAPTRINAGETGRANFVAVGDRTEVVVWVSGVPAMLASRPVHLYTFLYRGTCADSGTLAYALTSQVLAQSPSSTSLAPAGGPFTVRNMVPVPLEALMREAYALRVFTAPADGNREIFCGDMGPR